MSVCLMPPRKQSCVRPLCRHCKMRVAGRLRGPDGHFQLCEKCWGCWPIRKRFLPNSPFAHRGVRQEEDKPSLNDFLVFGDKQLRRIACAPVPYKITLVRVGQGMLEPEFGAALTPPVTASMVERWENGKQEPKPERLLSIARRFSLPLWVFFPDIERPD
jgi:hypothetical protein